MGPAEPSGKWSSALLPADVLGLYSDVLDSRDVVPLSAWGETDLGAVTGNNRYFCLSSGEARAAALERRELTPISPPGSRQLRGLGLAYATWRELERGGRKVWLFSPGHRPSHAALTYIAGGEAAEVHEAYKCRVRSPWWKVPQLAPPDLFVTYMNADSPRIVANEAQVTYLNSVHGVRVEPSLRDLAWRLLPIAALNSATILGAELVGRSYGGGILKLEPKEADLLPVPAPALVRRCDAALSALRPVLAEHLRQGDLLGASEKVDRVLLRSGMGVRQLDLKALREARAMLHDRRKTRGRR